MPAYVHLAYEPQDPFTLQPQPQVSPTSHTPATTLIEMCSPLPTPLIQLQPPHKPHLIECGRPICTPAAHTSSFTCNATPTLTDVTPYIVSDIVRTPNYTAIPNVTVTQLGSSDVTQVTGAKHTANMTHNEIACRKNAPVTSVTPVSVQPSTNTANTSTTTSQVATPTFPSVVVKQLTQPKPFNGTTSWKPTKNIMKGFAQLMVGPHSKRKLRT